jgi:hypothetical protein
VAPLLRKQLDRGELRPVYLFDKVQTCKVGEGEIRRLEPEGLSFLNMNTAEDYALALKYWEERQGAGQTAISSNSLSLALALSHL